VIDPFALKPGRFALEFVDLQVVAGAAAKGPELADVNATIETLGLNLADCRQQRREYVEAYQDGGITLRYLEHRAPFVAQELRRQGLLRPEDRGPSRR
jgi:hypothetical protein